MEMGTFETGEFMNEYSAILAEKIRKATGEDQPLKGFRVVVDAGNGAGGFYVDKVLKPLGADTRGSRFLEPDGMLPQSHSQPRKRAGHGEPSGKPWLESHADLGIIFRHRCGPGRRGTE